MVKGVCIWICRHDVEHPVWAMEQMKGPWNKHKCDGCCMSGDTFDYELLEDERKDRMNNGK